jgi:hypothetical protein
MAAMPMVGAGHQANLAGHDDSRVERAFCQAACHDLGSAVVSSTSNAASFPHAALIQRLVLVLQAQPEQAALPIGRIDPPPPSKPPFLAARLLI